MDSAWWLALVIPVVASTAGLVTWWMRSRVEEIRRERERRDLGNPETTLEEIDMFKYQITDIEKYWNA